MAEAISTSTWFQPREPADCPVCREARTALSAERIVLAGGLAIDLLSGSGVVSLLQNVLLRVAQAVQASRVSVLVPEAVGRWRVFASSADHETHDILIDAERYPELLEVRRTVAPYVAADVDTAPEFKGALRVIRAAGVTGVAAFPIFVASPGVEPAVMKVSFFEPATPDRVAFATLAAHLLVHRLARLPRAEVAAQLGMPAPAASSTDAAALLKLLPIPACLVDAGGRIVHANARALWLVRGREPAAPDDPLQLRFRPDQPWAGATSRWEARVVGKKGELRVLGWSTKLGNERRLILMEPHPEARRRAHERAIRETLAQKLRELEDANALLAEYARVRDRFVSDAAHELKTPLSILRSYLDTLNDDLAAGLSVQQREFLAAAAHGAQRLQRLIDELLDLAALDAARLPMALGAVSSAGVIGAVLDELQPVATAARVALEGRVSDDMAVRADPDRLRQVLRNLVENGLKYTRPGGEVAVTTSRNGDRALLCVRDTGVGISADSLPRIWDEFVRLPGNHLSDGAGLGLAIVRRLVLAMGGRVWAESDPGSGSRFFVELPLWTGEG